MIRGGILQQIRHIPEKHIVRLLARLSMPFSQANRRHPHSASSHSSSHNVHSLSTKLLHSKGSRFTAGALRSDG